MDKDKLIEGFKEWWKAVAILLIAASLIFIDARGTAGTARKLEAVTTETHTALCTFKLDLERRFEDTKDYLEKHLGKEPIPGITRADLRRSLDAQRSTLDALGVLDCDT